MSNIAKNTLGARFKAWWHGDDLTEAVERAVDGHFSDGEPLKARERPVFYEEEEIEAAQKLWGDGAFGPLGGLFVRGLYVPFALDESKSVLEIGAGLGTLARQINKDTRAYVTGLEADPQVVKAGMAISKKNSQGKEAVVKRFDPEDMALDRRYDAIISICSLFHVERKDQAIEAIAAAIKPQSYIQLVDFAMMDGAESLPEVAAWLAVERREPHPWSPSHIQSGLRDVGFTIKTVEDCTVGFERTVLDGFTEMLERLPTCKSDQDVKPFILLETEIWARRLVAMRSGGLRVLRVLATTDPSFGA